MTTQATFDTILKEVGRALVALAPYRNSIILVGGLVPVLYRRMPSFRVPEHPPLATTEADLAIPPKLAVVDGKSLPDLLLAAGFVIYEAPGLSLKRPGKLFFQDKAHGTERAARTYLEFLTPLIGKPRDGFIEPHPGIRAPPLRFLDLLAHAPLTVDIKGIPALDVDVPCDVRIPHPTLYVLQKVLARGSGRSPAKQPKDMAYAYDVAVLTQPLWAHLKATVDGARSAKPEWAKWIERATESLSDLFATETSDGTIEAARIYRDVLRNASPSEEAIATTVRAFVDAIR